MSLLTNDLEKKKQNYTRDHSLVLYVNGTREYQQRHIRVVKRYVQKYGHPHDRYDYHPEQAGFVRHVLHTVDRDRD